MLETIIPNAVSVYKQVKGLIGSATTGGRVRIGMGNTDMKVVCENDADTEHIRMILRENGITIASEVVAPRVHIEAPKKQHTYTPSPKVSKRKGK